MSGWGAHRASTAQPLSPAFTPALDVMLFGLHDEAVPLSIRRRLPTSPSSPPPGLSDDGHDLARAYMAWDWLVRTWLPAWLDQTPQCNDAEAERTRHHLRGVAQTLRRHQRLSDLPAATLATPLVRTAAQLTAQNAAAVWHATKLNSWQLPTWDDAAHVAGPATGDPAGRAFWAAAERDHEAVGYQQARSAARSAAASSIAARSTTHPALVRTVRELQDSAVELYRRMSGVHGTGRA